MGKKYIKNFESFKNSNNLDSVNEELLGKLVNFLKGVFKKAQERIKKLTSIDDIKKFFQSDILSIKSDVSIFSGVFKEYNAKPQFNDQDCFDFISKLVDPDDSVMSTKSIQDFLTGFDDERRKKEVQFLFEEIRNKTLAFFQYGGNSAKSFVVGKALPVPAIKPDLKSGKAIQRTPDGNGFVDKKHLPELKKVIAGITDDKKKSVVLNWVNNIFIKKMIDIENSITNEQIDEFVGDIDGEDKDVDVYKSYGIESGKNEDFVGKDIYYMMDGYNESEPNKDFVGKGKVNEFDETKGFNIETEKGTKFYKTPDKLIAKDQAEKLLGISSDEMNYDKLDKLYNDKKDVIYLLPDVDKESYDSNKKPEEQTDFVGVGKITSLDDNNDDKSVKFEDDGKTIERSYSDIVGVVDDRSEEANSAAEELAKIKDDPDSMKKVSSYAKFLQDKENNKDKIDQIDQIINGQ